MPVAGRPKREPSGKVLLSGALALLWGMGCFFNLDIPVLPAAPPPPSVSVLAPQPGDTVTLTQEVSVVADSVNGIQSVTLLCGPTTGARQAYVWSAPPFQALVDLSVCEGLTTPSADGGLPSLQLSIQVLSTADAGSEQDIQVFLNAVGPAIAVQYPPTAQPKSPFTVTVTVTSGPPLASYPVVMLAGAAADSVTQVSGATLPTYVAFFQSTPGIGTDNYAYVKGQPVPIEVLTDTDEVVRLTVDATAPSGNTTSVDLSVDLSRLVWDRYIPGVPAENSPITWAAEPVAYDGGLVLPLATTSGGGADAVWIPGRLSRDDGTFYGFVSSILPGGLDGGYLARGIDSQGETLFFEPVDEGGNFLLAPPPSTISPLVPTNLEVNPVNAPLTRVSGGGSVPDLLCLPDSLPACSNEAVESLTCFTAQLTAVTVASGIVSTGPPNVGVVAGGGGRYLSPNAAVCGSSWNLVDLTNGTVTFGPTSDPNGTARDCSVTAVTRLLAVGDGTFVVQLASACDETGVDEFPILRVGPDSSIQGAYTAPLGTPRTVQRELVGVLADGGVITLTNNPPNTDFQLWSMNRSVADVPDITSSIAGLYDSADALEGSVVARSTYSAEDGSFAVLVSGAPLGVGVIAFGPSLQPLWLYLYPRVTSTDAARLISSASVGDVYLVDNSNNRAISLRVEPPAGSAAVPTPDAGVPDAGSPDAGSCTLCLTFSLDTVYLAPNTNDAQISVTTNAPEAIVGTVYIAGTGPGGALVGPPDVTFEPNPPGSQMLGPPGGYNQYYVELSASAAAKPGQAEVTMTATYLDAGFELTDTASFLVAIVPELSLTVSPPSATLVTGASQQFQATVVGPPNTQVRWQLESGGTLSSTTANPVTYTAPATPGTYDIYVTSVAAPSLFVIITVTVTGD